MRVTTGAAVSVLFAPGTGGDPANACGNGCSSRLGVGISADVEAGVRFGTGLGISLTGGYFALSKVYDARSFQATPTGHEPATGTAHDALTLEGPRVGVMGSFERGHTWKYSARLSAGALFANWSIERHALLTPQVRNADGTVTPATTAPLPVPGSSDPDTELRSGGSRVAPYVSPEVRLGYAVTRSITAEIAVSGTFLFALNEAKWGTRVNDQFRLNAPGCPGDTNRCQGLLQFDDNESLFGAVIAVGALSLGATARF